jgi:hypothetical protein
MKLLELEKHLKKIRYYSERIHSAPTKDDKECWEAKEHGYMAALETCFEFTSDEMYIDLLWDYCRDVFHEIEGD